MNTGEKHFVTLKEFRSILDTIEQQIKEAHGFTEDVIKIAVSTENHDAGHSWSRSGYLVDAGRLSWTIHHFERYDASTNTTTSKITGTSIMIDTVGIYKEYEDYVEEAGLTGSQRFGDNIDL